MRKPILIITHPQCLSQEAARNIIKTVKSNGLGDNYHVLIFDEGMTATMLGDDGKLLEVDSEEFMEFMKSNKK